jgi:hypothetical protein
VPIISGGSGGAGGAAAQLFDLTLTGSAVSIDATGLGQAANHLLILLKLRDDGAVVLSSSNLRFNADSTAGHYNQEITQGLNATASASAGTATALSYNNCVGASASADAYGTCSLFVPAYRDAHLKTLSGATGMFGTTGTATTYETQNVAGIWVNTAAISRVTVTPGDGTNFVAGSRLTIYGLT